MNKKFRPLCIGTALLAGSAFGAVAQDMMAEGLYLGAGAGLNQTRDSDISGTGISTNAELDRGYLLLGSIGYDWAGPLRSELELSYRSNDIDDVGGVAGSGGIKSYGAMVNLFYDFALGNAFTPYLGVGLGALRLDADDIRTVGGSSVDGR